jgi:hypothetical protein
MPAFGISSLMFLDFGSISFHHICYVAIACYRMGVIGRYHFEIAEQYHNSLKDNGLTVDMIQVDDE